MKTIEILRQLKVPRNKTALMQYLQLLVFSGNRHWCGGAVEHRKLASLVCKMADRYPILRSERGRSYDRKKGLATVHFVAYPRNFDTVYWWLLSSEGKGGLADPTSADSHVSRDAMAAGAHIEFDDYLLLYAHKRDARTILDGQTGKEKTVLKDMSTWTWKLTPNAFNEVKAALEVAAAALNFGNEGPPGRRPWGVRGILRMQRSRPLFSGVRSQVIELHRYGEKVWGRVQKRWEGMHSDLRQDSDRSFGTLPDLQSLMHSELPKMRRIRVYDTPVYTLQNLCR